jgi:hypothetical protein
MLEVKQSMTAVQAQYVSRKHEMKGRHERDAIKPLEGMATSAIRAAETNSLIPSLDVQGVQMITSRKGNSSTRLLAVSVKLDRLVLLSMLLTLRHLLELETNGDWITHGVT